MSMFTTSRTVSVESQPGKGTVFIIRLPLVRKTASRSQELAQCH